MLSPSGNPIPAGASTPDSGVTDLRAWKRLQQPPRPRRRSQPGLAYLQEAEPYWRASYDAQRIRRLLLSFETPQDHEVLYSLRCGERQVLFLLVHWHEGIGSGPATPKRLARGVGVRRQAIHPILNRLGRGRILVNLGSPRAQNLAINGRFHEWDLALVRKLRNAESAEINARTGRTK